LKEIKTEKTEKGTGTKKETGTKIKRPCAN